MTHVLIVDSMAACLGLEKGRSSAPGLAALARRTAARVLAWYAFLVWRQVPSEYKPADEPSRRIAGTKARWHQRSPAWA